MTPNAHDAGIGDLHIATPRKEIVFIEDDVPDIGTLLGGIGRGKDVVILDSRQDGLLQIAQALAGRSGIDALHIVSHGDAGAVDLGNLILNAGNLDTHQDDLQTIRQAMSVDGDILLYGCKIGADAGFVQQLAIATGADVAASSDLTGATALGGNWNLEVTSGTIETAPAIDADTAALYRDVLGLSPGTLQFNQLSNFVSGLDVSQQVALSAATDVIYLVNHDGAYALLVDGASTGVTANSGTPGRIYAGMYGTETAVTMSFVGGQSFTPTSIALANFSLGGTTPVENLVIKGYDAGGHQVGTTTTYALPWNNAYTSHAISLANLGGGAVSTLKITGNGGSLDAVMIDSISIASITPPPPNVVSVTSSTPNGAYKAGDVIHVQVVFSEAVAITGTPTLKLETGTTDQVVSYAQGTGTSTLTFDYTVQAGDTSADLDYFNTSALALNGGTIKSVANGSDATLTLPAPGTLTSLSGVHTIVIDTTAPNAPTTPSLTTASDTGTSTSDHITKNATPTFTGTFSSSDVTTVTLYDEDLHAVGSGAVSGGTYTITVTTPLADGNHTLGAIATDAAGNTSPISGGNAITVDTTAPTVTVTSSNGTSTLKAGDTATVTFTFSEDPGGTFTGADVVVSGGTLGTLSGTGTVRTMTFTPTANINNGTGSVSVTAHSYADTAGNLGGAGTAVNIAYDTQAPTLTIASDKSTLKAGETAAITFTFSEDPGSTFTAGDVTVSGGTLGALSGSGTTRTATFTPDANVASGTASITVVAGSYLDAAGNAGGAGTTPSLAVHTLVPGAPAQVALASDTGTSSTDGITNRTQLVFGGTAAAGATVKLYDTDGTTQIGSGAADGTGNWTITTSTLSEGAHTVVATAFDGYGNASAPAAGVAVVVDTTAPTLAIVSDKAALKAGETATITFTFSEDPGATFTAGDVHVTGGLLSALSGSGTTRTATFTPTADTDDGHASIGVDAGAYTDAAGNDGAARTGPALTFDTKLPAAPPAPDLASGSDSGVSSTDDVTNAATPTFTGAAGSVEGGATVKLYDGAAVVATTTAAGDGSWSVAAGTLAEGAHTMTATAVDAAGNESAASPGLAVTIDRTAPAAQAAAVAFSADTGSSAADLVTSAPHQTITVTLDATPQAGDTVRVSLDNGATWSTATVDGTTATLAATLAGSGTLQVQLADAAGNAGPVYSHAYVLDTAAPAAPSTPDLASGSDTGLSNGDDITSATQPTFTGTAESGATVTLYDGATAIGTGVAAGGTWQITAATPLGQGSHTITATATDAAGNTGAASSGLAVQVVTAAPATGVASMALAADSGVSAGDFVTNVAAQTLSGTLDAALAAGERVQVSLDHGASWADATATIGASAWSFGTVLAAGSHDIQVRVLDAIGNAGPVHTQAYTLDATAPTLAIASATNPLKAGDTATITFTFSDDPGATFTTEDVAVSGGTLSALSGTGTVRTATFTPDAGMDGATATIAVAAGSYTDAAGNAGGAGAPVSLWIDTLVPGAPPAPVLDAASHTGTAPTDGLTNLARPTIEGVADAHAVIMVYDGMARMVGVTIADGAGAWHVQTDTLADGYHVLYAVQYDAIGNVSPFGAPLVVQVDTQAPAAPSAPSLAAASDSGTPGDRITKVATPTFSGRADAMAQVTLYDSDGHTALGTARADANGNWTIATSPLADGTHDVTVRQSDPAGNWSAPSQAVALTVDTEAPSAPSAPQLQPQSDTGVRGDGVTYAVPVLAGSAAAGDLVTLYDGTRAVGTAHAGTDGKWTIAAQGLAVGRHTLTATDTDAAGNVSAPSGAFALTIEAAPVPLVDGVPVVTVPVLLPGGGGGVQLQVPIVGADRADAGGAGGTADIPLAGTLTAHVAPGYGLTATGGPATTAADGGAALFAAIQAAAGTDAAPLAGNGTSYLAQLAANQPLLVQTIAPVTGAQAPAGTLTLSGTAGGQQHVALVIDAAGMAGGTIALQDVDFAAVVGAAHVVAQAGTKMVAGDAAAQDITVQAGSGTQLFAGGGNDVLRFGVGAGGASVAHGADGVAAAAAAPTTTLLHGGSGDDTAVFAGARADFDIDTHHGYLVVRSKAAPDAQALVVNVEHLQFSDTTVAAQDDAGLAPLAGLYRAVLGRQADIHGLDFWAGVHDQGVSLGTIALAMIGSGERLGTQGGFDGDAGHDVGVLYAALFDRAADPTGLAFWTTALQHGATLAQVADAMVQSVEMVGQQGTPPDWNFSV